MVLEDILPGCRIEVVELESMDADSANQTKSYPSALYSVIDSHSIEITVPTLKAKMVPLPLGTEYYFVFTTSNGLVRAKGVAEQRYQRDNFYLQKIKIDGKLSKYQRREFFRLDCMFPIIYFSLNEERGQMKTVAEIEESLQNAPKTEYFQGMGTAIDISGGGMRFTSSVNLENIPYILTKFQLDFSNGKKDFAIAARIVQSYHIDGANKYSHRVQFINLDEGEREKIIRYIFETERIRRQKA